MKKIRKPEKNPGIASFVLRYAEDIISDPGIKGVKASRQSFDVASI